MCLCVCVCRLTKGIMKKADLTAPKTFSIGTLKSIPSLLHKTLIESNKNSNNNADNDKNNITQHTSSITASIANVITLISGKHFFNFVQRCFFIVRSFNRGIQQAVRCIVGHFEKSCFKRPTHTHHIHNNISKYWPYGGRVCVCISVDPFEMCIHSLGNCDTGPTSVV